MTANEFQVALGVLGARLIEEATLPPGPGVLPMEVGQFGPWYGIQYTDGHIEGWDRTPENLGGLIKHHLTIDLLLHELEDVVRSLKHADREIRDLCRSLHECEKDLRRERDQPGAY